MDKVSLPKHICIVMDGNGRFAKKRGLARISGHQEGVKTAIDIVSACIELNIEIVSLYAFSTENWKRPKVEVDALFHLINDFFKNEVEKLNKLGVKVVAIGDISNLPQNVYKTITEGMKLTKKNKKITVLVALNYGGRWDMINAIKSIVEESPNTAIDEKLISSKLSTSGYPDPDLFIRTGGEMRLSNFMLWQLAYSELYFTDILWPDFTKDDLKVAIKYYQKRDRRFGGIKEGENS